MGCPFIGGGHSKSGIWWLGGQRTRKMSVERRMQQQPAPVEVVAPKGSGGGVGRHARTHTHTACCSVGPQPPCEGQQEHPRQPVVRPQVCTYIIPLPLEAAKLPCQHNWSCSLITQQALQFTAHLAAALMAAAAAWGSPSSMCATPLSSRASQEGCTALTRASAVWASPARCWARAVARCAAAAICSSPGYSLHAFIPHSSPDRACSTTLVISLTQIILQTNAEVCPSVCSSRKLQPEACLLSAKPAPHAVWRLV